MSLLKRLIMQLKLNLFLTSQAMDGEVMELITVQSFVIPNICLLLMVGFMNLKHRIQRQEIKIIVWNQQQLFKALEHSKPAPIEKKLEKKVKADEDDSFTPTRTIFIEANDTVKAIKDSSQPLTNLERAFTNLDTIDERNETVTDTEFQSLLGRIEKIVQKLKK